MAEDIPSSEVSCGMTEVTCRYRGFNPVAFTPALRAICGALDCLRPPPGAGRPVSGERRPSLAGAAVEVRWGQKS